MNILKCHHEPRKGSSQNATRDGHELLVQQFVSVCPSNKQVFSISHPHLLWQAPTQRQPPPSFVAPPLLGAASGLSPEKVGLGTAEHLFVQRRNSLEPLKWHFVLISKCHPEPPTHVPFLGGTDGICSCTSQCCSLVFLAESTPMQKVNPEGTF